MLYVSRVARLAVELQRCGGGATFMKHKQHTHMHHIAYSHVHYSAHAQLSCSSPPFTLHALPSHTRTCCLC